MARSRLPPSIACALLVLFPACMPPSWGAAALLHPSRRPVTAEPALAHAPFAFRHDGLTLRGWRFPAQAPARGVTVVYLHGVADNRASGTWLAEALVREGFEVVAYDSRAHGLSDGSACTYGALERRDLSAALDALGARRVVLLGVSLGGAVALEEAAADPRVVGVVAVATFSDLATVARERAPWYAWRGQVTEALRLAEREGGFRVADASPARAAAGVGAPVLLVHGADDRETSPAHSERILAALRAGGNARARLLRVAGAGHPDALGRAWPEVHAFVREVAGTAPDASAPSR